MKPLSKRLRAVLAHLGGTRVLYDVGTDHAYLPIAAVRKKGVESVIAVDNKPGPLSIAQKNVRDAGLEDKITLKLTEGLDSMSETVDTLTIAGLGGHTAARVVREGDIENTVRLIIQPNDHAEAVRALCDGSDLAIVDETFVIERNRLYVIIVMERGTMTLTERERVFGPVLLRKRDEAYMTYLESQRERLISTLQNIPDKETTALNEKLAMLEAILNERK